MKPPVKVVHRANKNEVTFSAPLTEHQTVDLDIKNDWNKTIIFKMKTTRPDAFKMKPVYGLVEAEKSNSDVKKWDPNKKPKKNDHFTVVMAPAPDKCNNPIKTWKSKYWRLPPTSEDNLQRDCAQRNKKKSPKDELAKAPIVKAEEIEEKKKRKLKQLRRKERRMRMKKVKVEAEEERRGRRGGAGREIKKEKKAKKEKAEDEKSKKKEEEEEDGKGKEEDEADEEDEEE
ncbi:Major sperm protein [Dirofilaria immitis]|nr:Major sperm protein [Dirofilaria immitis]